MHELYFDQVVIFMHVLFILNITSANFGRPGNTKPYMQSLLPPDLPPKCHRK